MGVNAPLGSFGTTSLATVQQKAGERAAPPSKYKEFMDAIHNIAYDEKNIDQQTELQWENIEGEVMGCVLVKDLISGTMMRPVRNRMFRFKDPKKQLDRIFLQKFVETIEHHPELMPAITTGKQKVNELLVSFQRHGRVELVEMLKAFQVQLQDTQGNDQKLLRR
jgi:hypothetical protein